MFSLSSETFHLPMIKIDFFLPGLVSRIPGGQMILKVGIYLAGHQPATRMLLSWRPKKDGVNLRFRLHTNRQDNESVSYTLTGSLKKCFRSISFWSGSVSWKPEHDRDPTVKYHFFIYCFFPFWSKIIL